jgi:hypothetical protein
MKHHKIPYFASCIVFLAGSFPCSAQTTSVQAWEYTLSLPAPHHRSIGLTGTNGTLVSIGGLPLEGNLNLVYALSPGASSWAKVSRLANDAAGIGAGIDFFGRIVVFGGLPVNATIPLTNGYVYDTVSGPGAAIASKNFAVYNFALAADDQHRIYAIGGRGAPGLPGEDSRGVERYDARSDSWEVLAPLLSPRTEGTAVYDGLGHILLIGGRDPTPPASITTTVFSYDIANNTWSQLANVPLALTGPANNGAAVLGADGLVYLVGTGDSAFDPGTKVWFSAPQQQIVRGSPGATLGLDGFIYMMGGDNTTVHGGLLDTVERLDTASRFNPLIVSSPVTTGKVGTDYAYQVAARGNPRPAYELVSGPPGMSLAADTGLLTWTPTPDQVGSFSTTVRAVNSEGTAEQTFAILVVTATTNTPPVLTVPGDQTTAELSLLSVSASATDPNIPPSVLTFGLDSAPAGMAIDPASGLITWTPSEAQGPSVSVVVVRVTNSAGLSVTQSFTVVVNELNTVPVLTAPADQTVSALALLSVSASATDSDIPANSLVFALVSAPAGMIIDPASGLITWTPTQEQSPSTNVVQVSVTDTNPAAVNANSLSVTQSFNVVVTPNVLVQPELYEPFISGDVVTLSWSSVAGKTYRVQFKSTLSDAQWLDLDGDVTAGGATAFKTDVKALTSRFYRILVVR